MKKFWQKLTHWELWPFNVIYTPLGVVWIYYAIRARAFWFFTPSNPTLIFAGFEGGSKKEMYDQLPDWSYPTTILVKAGIPEAALRDEIKKAGLQYPIVAKPDTGMQGVLFRVLENNTELMHYHGKLPVDYILQTFVDLPMEFSVFHIRYPGETKGMVTGFILKDYMHVKGDGQSSLEVLVNEHPKAKHRLAEMKQKHGANWASIIPEGEKYFLSYAGNHNRGARFINLHKEIDQRLCDVFDRISNESGSFYFGRYDLKCTSIEDLKEGKNLFLLEFNGAGAEPNHIYDCGMKYSKALKVVAMHWRHLYKIGAINHRKGVPYWGYWKGRKFLRNARKEFERLTKIDLSFT
ncbi:MAG TPA: hypothetical protein VLJ68_04500 [Chitinophagaceae bacterium]|nr:hypothetical protein [Chitinophagaceae bacterium]